MTENYGAKAVGPVIAFLAEEIWWVCYGAVEVLGKLQHKPKMEQSEIGMLIAALKDSNWGVRLAATWALGRIGDARAVDALISCLKDSDRDVRQGAAWALGQIGDARAVRPLIECLEDKYCDVRKYATVALGKIGDERVIESLVPRLTDRSWNVRWAAVRALGKIGGARAVEALIRCRKDAGGRVHEEVWYEAVVMAVLGEMGRTAVEALVECLLNSDAWVRAAAASVLEKLHYKAETKECEVRLLIAREQWEEVVNYGAGAVEPLIRCLKDREWKVRKEAVEVLGKIGDARAVQPLIGCLRDSNWRVRQGAALSLAKIGDKEAISHLAEVLADWFAGDAVANALVELGWRPSSWEEKVHLWVAKKDRVSLEEHWDETKRILLTEATSGEQNEMENAVYALIAIGKEEILDHLVRILEEHGTKAMAHTFLKCGNMRLSSAARVWAKARGYRISLLGRGCQVRWGSW